MHDSGGKSRDAFPESNQHILNLGFLIACDGGEFGHDDGGMHGPEGEQIILRVNGDNAERA